MTAPMPRPTPAVAGGLDPAAVADLLERAAERLESLAAEAGSRLPWALSGAGSWRDVVDSRGDAVAFGCVPGDAAWIAAVNPDAAPHLVTWLRDTADLFAKLAPAWVEWGRPLEGFGGPSARAAVGVARVVLGLETPPTGSGVDALRSRLQAPYAAQDVPGVPQGGSGGSEPEDRRTEPRGFVDGIAEAERIFDAMFASGDWNGQVSLGFASTFSQVLFEVRQGPADPDGLGINPEAHSAGRGKPTGEEGA